MSEAPKQLYWEIQNANNGIVDKLFSKIEEMQAVMAVLSSYIEPINNPSASECHLMIRPASPAFFSFAPSS